MPLSRRSLLAGSAGAVLAAPALARAASGAPIVIGEFNSYTAFPAFTLPYRNGMALALDEVNAAGGALGRPFRIVSKDDGASPQTAVRVAGELLGAEKADILAGGYLSNVGLAVSAFAAHTNKLYVAGEPLADELVWQRGTPTCFRLRPSTYMQVAMLLDAAAAVPGKRWATVAPNYAYGTSAVKSFKALLTAKRPDVRFVAEEWPALGAIDAGATVGALAAASPDAIFNVTFGDDLTAFVRQGNTRGLFKNRAVLSLLTGEPEYLDPLGADTPVGWIVTGYPGAAAKSAANTAFCDKYRKRFNAEPGMGSVVGYTLIASIAAGVRAAGGLATQALETGFAGAQFQSPFGPAHYRALDHQSTLGDYVGRLALAGGKGVMTDFHYVDGASVLPADSVVDALRPHAG